MLFSPGLTVVLTLALFSVAAWLTPKPAAAGASATAVQSVRPLWTVSRMHIPAGSPATEEQAKALLFKPMDMGAAFIAFNGRVCDGLQIVRRPVALGRYLKETYGARLEDLGLDDEQATLISSGCDIEGCQAILRLQDATLLIQAKGVFYFLAPNLTF